MASGRIMSSRSLTESSVFAATEETREARGRGDEPVFRVDETFVEERRLDAGEVFPDVFFLDARGVFCVDARDDFRVDA